MGPKENLANKTSDIERKNKILVEKDSIQYNSQELEQEQKVDMNPVQKNTHNVNVYVCNDNNDYSAKITGSAYTEDTHKIVRNVNISLFFGTDDVHPIYKTTSDENGNYVIEDLPPGYYSIQAYGDHFRYKSGLIKVFPCQNCNHIILLRM